MVKRSITVPVEAPETRGRKSTWAPEVKKVRKGGKKSFESLTDAKGFQRAAKRLGRKPAFRTINGVLFVYLDQEGY